MNILIIDTETTGLDPAQGAELIEIGAILYSVPSRAILAQVSTLLAVVRNGQEDVHRISWESAHATPYSIQSAALKLVSNMALNADYAVAHNANFDRQFALKYIDTATPWLCTYEDFNFTPYKAQNLVNLALAHGITVKSAHRALNDCGLIAEIFSKRDDLEALIEAAIVRAKSPKVWVRALVSYADRGLASKARFAWNSGSKDWRKSIKECDLEALKFDFKWELI